jgi:diaminohydroxyphosphoribosylaminopyrimidine deaminase / 5-amino-6-(5-phosphoribosylamino)uracil reductase
MDSVADDTRFMRLALEIGRRGLGNTWPNPAVGAVIVSDGAIVGRGWTQPGGRPHAETEALRRAGEAAKGATLYVTLEPCSHHGKTPPCADAIVAAGVTRVVSALEDPNPEVAGQGLARLRDAGIEVVTGLCEEEARRAHAGHIRRIKDGRPHVTLKFAVSSDGKTGLAGRRPVQISGEAARARVHMLRAMNDAVLVGIGTALADNPLLTCRLPGMQKHSPVRVVLDSKLRLPPEHALVATARETPLWVIAAPDASVDREKALQEAGVEVLRSGKGEGGLDVKKALQVLGEKGITRLLVEPGPIVAASFLKAELIDEAVVIRSPAVLGADAIDAIEGLSLKSLTDSLKFRIAERDKLGADQLTVYERM